MRAIASEDWTPGRKLAAYEGVPVLCPATNAKFLFLGGHGYTSIETMAIFPTGTAIYMPFGISVFKYM